MAYLHEGTEYAGFDGFGCAGDRPCAACQRKADALSEYYIEDDADNDGRVKGAGFAGVGGVAESAAPPAITRALKVVVKSYIAPIGLNAGSPYCGGFINPTADLRLRALGVATDAAMSENPLTDVKDKRYRLYSSRTFEVTCSNGRIVSVVPSPVDTDSGTECIPRTSACLQPPPLVVSNVTGGIAPPSGFRFSWTAKGRPHLAAEPAFQAVCPRTSVYIWHTISGRIECAGGEPRVLDVRLVGSRFPSHRAFVNGAILPLTIAQGPFSNLWVPSAMSSPTLVR